MELFEQIRREYEHGVGTISGVARKFGIHRRMVREALESAVPCERKRAERGRPKVGQAESFIKSVLESDKRAPRKQRHTAHRIWCRLRQEMPQIEISESTVRKYVRECKESMGLAGREVFIDQKYDWGVEAQIDWYEARAELDGEPRDLCIFCMRSMAGGGAFHRAYPHASQQAFLEGHELGFEYFGGVFRLLRYDNLASAVKKILRGHQRQETERFIAFRSHWGFESEFCTVARGNEKGGVEAEGGYFRRNHLVPVPKADSLDELNQKLLEWCRQDEGRMVGGRSSSIGESMNREREYLLPLVPEGFDLAGIYFPQVNAKGTVKVLTNFYSVPVSAGLEVQAKVYPAHVEIWHQGGCIARHERCFGRFDQVLDLEHYLEVLLKKPGALAGSRALDQWRSKGRWAEVYDELWRILRERQGKQDGTRSMVEILLIGKEHGWKPLQEAVEEALRLGCFDVSAVRLLAQSSGVDGQRVAETVEIGTLSRYDRPQPGLEEYDRLLREWPGGEVVQ